MPPESVAQFKRKKSLIIGGAVVFGLGYYAALAASSAGSRATGPTHENTSRG
ncbi:MAG: hypothetical protein R3B70_07685 [Polyangiaceae bacterium]